jgi:hypothetical protein
VTQDTNAGWSDGTPATSADHHAGALETRTDEEREEVAGIRADIEETRLEMGGTLNELGDRLEPGHLMDQARENVREATIGRVEETAKGISDMVMDTIKRNPIPAAMAGAGLALLWANRSQSGPQFREGYGYQGRPASMYGDQGSRDLGSRVGGVASAVGENVGGAVGSVAEGAQHVGGEAIERAGETAQQVGWRLERFMRANPLAVAAIAAGTGAAIGSVVPETSKEREMLGDASRQLTSAVRDTVDDATAKAEETMDRAEAQVGSPA